MDFVLTFGCIAIELFGSSKLNAASHCRSLLASSFGKTVDLASSLPQNILEKAQRTPTTLIGYIICNMGVAGSTINTQCNSL